MAIFCTYLTICDIFFSEFQDLKIRYLGLNPIQQEGLIAHKLTKRQKCQWSVNSKKKKRKVRITVLGPRIPPYMRHISWKSANVYTTIWIVNKASVMISTVCDNTVLGRGVVMYWTVLAILCQGELSKQCIVRTRWPLISHFEPSQTLLHLGQNIVTKNCLLQNPTSELPISTSTWF